MGGYYGGTFGDISVSDVSVSPGTLGVNRVDAGLLASIQSRYPIVPKVHVLLDVRGTLGLVNQATNTDINSFKNRDIQVLAGLGYSF